jgi:hypothetical protein
MIKIPLTKQNMKHFSDVCVPVNHSNKNHCKPHLYIIWGIMCVFSTKCLLIINKNINFKKIEIIPSKHKQCKTDAYISKMTPPLNYVRGLSCDFKQWYYPDKVIETPIIVPIQKVNEPIIQYNIDKLYIIILSICIIVLFICIILITNYLLKTIKILMNYLKKIEERLNKIEEDNKELRKIINETHNPKSSYM